MSKRHWKLRVEDIITSAERIQDYIKSMTYEEFASDQKTVDAVIRNLEIIGEASKFIPEELMEKFNYINWEGIIGLRNIIAHFYFGIDLQIIWRITQDQLPDFVKQIQKLLSTDIP